jgi:hypothetical protein
VLLSETTDHIDLSQIITFGGPMNIRNASIIISFLLICLPTLSRAQDTTSALKFGDSFGISASYSEATSIGLRFPLSHALLMRPSISFANERVTYPGTISPEHSTLSLDVSIDALFSLINSSAQQFQPYCGFGVGMSYNDSRPPLIVQRQLILKIITGGNYWLSSHFGFFTEVGFLSYSNINDRDLSLRTFGSIGICLSL